MNNLLTVVIAIAATVLFLLLREFILSAGKKGRNPFRRRSDTSEFHPVEGRLKLRPLRAVPTSRAEQRRPDAPAVEGEEFLTELAAKAGERKSPSRTTDGSDSDLAADQHHRNLLAGGWR